ncbi:hypothetical protein OAU50_02685 [Planctomycetota bacterium]|nr:hypothetical protein [Planctomycetota bacterium]
MKFAMTILAGLIFTVGIGANELQAQRHSSSSHKTHAHGQSHAKKSNAHTHIEHRTISKRVWVPATYRIKKQTVREPGYYKIVLEKRFDRCGHAHYVRVRRYIKGRCVTKNVRVRVPGKWKTVKECVPVKVRCDVDHNPRRGKKHVEKVNKRKNRKSSKRGSGRVEVKVNAGKRFRGR